MKYLKVFLIALAITIGVGGVATSIYLHILQQNANKVKIVNDEDFGKDDELIKLELKDAKNLKQAISASDRVNFIICGLDSIRTDTIIFVSYDIKYKKIDVMSIPRDTYIDVPGKEAADLHKINAVYGMGKKYGGMAGVKTQVSQILSVPIHYYVLVDYRGVKNIVDLVGGVDVKITQRMFYDDPTSEPPLHIHFEPGNYTLKGNRAIEFLRWRKNNDGSGGGSDLDRNKRQIEFAKNLAYKSLTSLNFIAIAQNAFKFVQTDISLDDIVYYATSLADFNMEEDFRTHKLPGKERFTKLSYFFHDVDETKKLMYDIYMSGYLESNEAKNNKMQSKNSSHYDKKEIDKQYKNSNINNDNESNSN